ncbi:MAG: hypothetical protein V3V49_12895 [Candidatus Krumholzibacteria bacterium]
MKRVTIRVDDKLWARLQKRVLELKLRGAKVGGKQASLNALCEDLLRRGLAKGK